MKRDEKKDRDGRNLSSISITMDNRKKCIIIGNCQASQLASTLMLSVEFADNFDIVRFPPVHKISEIKVRELHELLPSVDLLISQPISENYRKNIGLGTKTLQSKLCRGALITWPVVYWDAYNPELFYFKDKNNLTVTDEFDYHHYFIFKNYLEKRSIKEVADTFFDHGKNILLQSTADAGLSNLARKEKDLDIKVSQYIRDNYKDNLLFFTYNHPAQKIILFIAFQILKKMNLNFDPEALLIKKDGLNTTKYPILPSVYEKIGLRFGDENFFKIRNEKISLLQVLKKYYSFYDRNEDLLNINKRIQNLSRNGIFESI